MLRPFINLKHKRKNNQKKTVGASPRKPDTGLCGIFRQGLQLKTSSKERLSEQQEKGRRFFNNWNEWRLELAFESFDLSMRYALHEILYLLHENYQKLEEWQFRVFRNDERNRDDSEEDLYTTNLYLPGAPHGVKGILDLSPQFRQEFIDYVCATFGDPPEPIRDGTEPPIEAVFCIGSIGTIGHKSVSSDLDLEIQYHLQPSLVDTEGWDDALLLQALNRERKSLIKRYFRKKGIARIGEVPESQRKRAYDFFGKSLHKKYPLLCRHLLVGDIDVCRRIQQTGDLKLRYRLVLEITELMQRHLSESVSRQDVDQREDLLKQRIGLIQDYIQKRFPESEIYLFPFSRTDFQRGYFGSTLDSKESSGGAYELIMNYETLMPGIYFIPVVPDHFLFSQAVNNDADLFEKYTRFIQFGLLEDFNEIRSCVTFQGPTPDLDVAYVAGHSSAAYWEAFKASSGNLPKATLNLLRFEMLLDEQLNKTIIQLIKDPDTLDQLLRKGRRLAESVSMENYPFPPVELVAFEKEQGMLRFDPWWLKYKTLKFGFGIPGLIAGISPEENVRISNLLDLAFALHIRLSDVFSLQRHTSDNWKNRERVLTAFLETVFPESSDRRRELHSIVIGDVQAVNRFEKELRGVFLRSVQRIHQTVGEMNTGLDHQETKEFEIWYYYFEKHFMPGRNAVQKSILNHLQVPRGRLQIGFIPGKGWFFKALQKGAESSTASSHDILKLMPAEVVLKEKTHFLPGLAHCVINRYYGIFNEGRLNETRTVVEYDRSHSQLNSRYDNQLAFVRPDQLERITLRIRELFPDEKADYLECIKGTQEIREVMVFLNLSKFGQLAILYRDNLKNLFVDHFNLPGFEKNVDSFIADYRRMLRSKPLHVTLARFFKEKAVNLEEIRLEAWVNANSADTGHSSVNHAGKDRDLASEFKETLFQIHLR